MPCPSAVIPCKVVRRRIPSSGRAGECPCGGQPSGSAFRKRSGRQEAELQPHFLVELLRGRSPGACGLGDLTAPVTGKRPNGGVRNSSSLRWTRRFSCSKVCVIHRSCVYPCWSLRTGSWTHPLIRGDVSPSLRDVVGVYSISGESKGNGVRRGRSWVVGRPAPYRGSSATDWTSVLVPRAWGKGSYSVGQFPTGRPGSDVPETDTRCSSLKYSR